VEFKDGSIKAQLGCPDMRLPIQYALSYPERWSNPTLPRLDWDDLKNLTFEPPDTTRFPCLELAISAGRQGGTSPAVLCGADEAAVELFRRGQIKFTDIASLISRVLEEHRPVARPTLDEVLAADAWAREKVTQLTSGDSPCHP
jgi:1-deoxy-D-xylulose-5-phosphate reductoisomerase